MFLSISSSKIAAGLQSKKLQISRALYPTAGARRAFPVGRGNLSRDKFPTTQAPTDTVTQSPNDRQHNSVKNIEMFKNRLTCTIMRGFIIESRLNVFVYCVWLNNTCAYNRVFFQEFCLGEIFWDVCKKRFMYKNFIKVLHYAADYVILHTLIKYQSTFFFSIWTNHRNRWAQS